MVKICAVRSCSSRRKNKTKIKGVTSVSFFQPTSQSRLKEWSKALDINLKPSDFVCQLHFKKEDIKFNYKIVMGNNVHCQYLKKKILTRDAVPTVEYQEQYYPVVQDEAESTERRHRRRSGPCEHEHISDIPHPMKYLKNKISALPKHWSYVEKANEIGFMRIDPVSKKILNYIILKDDFTVMAIGANNRKIRLDEKLTSPDEVYEYLKYVENWIPCVGTRLQKQKYSKLCDGLVFNDDKNVIFPRCKPCKVLRCRLRNNKKNENTLKTPVRRKQTDESILRQYLQGKDSPSNMEGSKSESVQQKREPQLMTGSVDVDLDNLDSVKQKLKTIWSSPQFCGLCYYNGECCPVNTELIINRQNFSKCLRDIVNYVFNDDAGNLMSSSYLCDSCIEKTIQAYIFIHNTRQMSRIMDNAVSDMFSKVNDINNQLSPVIDYNSANVMIVLENDSFMYKSLINTKINEIGHTFIPVPMTELTTNSSINKSLTTKLSNIQIEIDETDVKSECSEIDETNTEIELFAKDNVKDEYTDINTELTETDQTENEYLEMDTSIDEIDDTQIESSESDTEMTEIEEVDRSVSLKNTSSKSDIKITKFIPISMPIANKRLSTKVDSKQIKRILTKTRAAEMQDSPKTKMVPNIISLSKLKDIHKTNKNIQIVRRIAAMSMSKESSKSDKVMQCDSSLTHVARKSPKLETTKKIIILKSGEDIPETSTTLKADNMVIQSASNVMLKKGMLLIKPTKTKATQ